MLLSNVQTKISIYSIFIILTVPGNMTAIRSARHMIVRLLLNLVYNRTVTGFIEFIGCILLHLRLFINGQIRFSKIFNIILFEYSCVNTWLAWLAVGWESHEKKKKKNFSPRRLDDQPSHKQRKNIAGMCVFFNRFIDFKNFK